MKAKTSKRKTHSKKGVESNEPILVDSSISQLTYIDSLLDTCILSLGEIKEIELSMSDFSEGEAQEMIEYLLINQVDRVSGGMNYTQGDILKKLSKLK